MFDSIDDYLTPFNARPHSGSAEQVKRIMTSVCNASVTLFSRNCGPLSAMAAVDAVLAIRADVEKRFSGELEDAKKKDAIYLEKVKAKRAKLAKLQGADTMAISDFIGEDEA